MRPRRLLVARRHAVFELAPGLLLVFKPRGHREDAHAHPHRQRLRVLRGALKVSVGRRTVALSAGSRPLTLATGRVHATLAAKDSWILAETLPSEDRRA